MSRKVKNNVWGWLFVLPSFTLLLVFIAFPIVRSFYLSLTDYNVLKPPTFAGVKNYVSAFKDPFVQASFSNTFQYVLTTVPIQTLLSMVIAALIAHGESEISNVYQVERGYEDLVGKLKSLGARIEIVEIED